MKRFIIYLRVIFYLSRNYNKIRSDAIKLYNELGLLQPDIAQIRTISIPGGGYKTRSPGDQKQAISKVLNSVVFIRSLLSEWVDGITEIVGEEKTNE